MRRDARFGEFVLAEALAAEFDAIGIADDPVEDRAGDGRGTAEVPTITPQTVVKGCASGGWPGHQRAKNMPWKTQFLGSWPAGSLPRIRTKSRRVTLCELARPALSA